MFYVYLHKKKTTGEVFYVGKGKGKRIYDKSRRNAAWRNIAKKCGIIYEFYLTGLQEWYALELEADLISYYGRLDQGYGTLVNLLDSDERPSGRKTLSGIASPRADKEKHLFRNLDTGEEFSGTRNDFQEKYKPKKHFVNHLFLKDKSVSNGWIVVDRFSEEEYRKIADNYNNPNKKKDKSCYTFINVFSREEVYCTRFEFTERFGVPHSTVATYFSKVKGTTLNSPTMGNGWFVREILPKEVLSRFESDTSYRKSRCKDKNYYEFLNLETKETFKGTRTDFNVKYNIDPTPLLKPNSKVQTLFKWCIPKILDDDTLNSLIESCGERNMSGLDNPNSDRNIYSLFNKETLESFNGTRSEFRQKYGFKINELFQSRRRKYVKGWCLV